jgi:hypothetical protein
MAHRLAGLQTIPAECVLIITQYLSFHDYHKLLRVCKTWRVLFSSLALKQHSELHKHIRYETIVRVHDTLLVQYATPNSDKYFDYVTVKRDTCKDDITFSFALYGKMGKNEFEKFRKLNRMEYGTGTPIEISPHYFIVNVPPRESDDPDINSKLEYLPSYTGREHYSNFRPINDFTRVIEDWNFESEWEPLCNLLRSINSTKKNVIYSEWNVPLADNGYEYSLYFRMPDRTVWAMKLEVSTKEVRYYNTAE